MKVSREIAAADVKRWLDAKKVTERKRESFKDQLEAMEDYVMEGILTIDENEIIRHELIHPLESDGETTLTNLTYKNRLKVSEITAHTKSVKGSDTDGRIMAYVSALTGTATGIIKGLDSDDYSVAQNIVVFFF